jgi:hypothetical protein
MNDGAMILVSIIIRITCAWSATYMAERRGRSPTGWAIACLVFGLIPLIVLACLSPPKPTAVQP